MKNDKLEKMKELIKLLNRYAYEYYSLDNPTASDKEYDLKYDELVSLEKETGIILSYSPTQRVGDIVLKEFKKYEHKAPLWSLDKAQSVEEIIEWDKRNKKAVEKYNLTHEEKLPELQYVITKKFDGLTINCTYDDEGILKKAATRGTGIIGEDITAQAKTIKSLPLKIDNHHTIEVHGEAVMTKKAFEEYNKVSEVPLKNLRNGAAGAIRNLNVKETARRNLSAFFYDVGYNEGNPFKSYMEMMNFIKEMGLPQDEYIKVCKNIKDIEKEIVYVGNIRDELEYDIDGIVIAIDDIRTRELLGYTIKFPKWAIAYKFEAKEATTKLLEIEWNVGRSGRVTPTALLQPVDLGGVTVKRATLNNMDDIGRKNVKLGATVFVRRSNDVIPEIMGVVEDTLEESVDIKAPLKCPYCGSNLVQNGVHYYCENSLSCKPQMVKSIVHFASREAMNIAGFSEKTAEQLFEKLDIKSICDLYKIKKEDLMNLEKFGEKKSENLIKAIEKSKDCTLPSFIYALGIPNVGKKTATDLVSEFKSLDKIKECSMEELVEVSDIGETVAQCIYEFFKDEKINLNIKELLDLGVNPKYEEKEIKSNPLIGKTIVITGTLNLYSRSEIKKKLQSMGAKVSSSVSKKTDYVLAGENPGSKYKKAQELGVDIMYEEKINDIIKNY
ncbi:NAD-dependent DNA ligase LigA [Clostridium oceanicum]|uniref:DNA ligase n=1 Tax=Clostridium oceanicum TaxID=1543 RepID=A0ABN1J9R3_9CLOT